ncbi:MAG TPA: hypothetical protein VFM94_09980 [Solirubrobacterales bacterium]|nr:hypothetical protein [Solirubrobacterales bacterium]
MRPGPAAIAVLLLALALILPGCGEEQTSAAGTVKSASRAARATAADAPAAGSGAASSDPVAARRCRGSLADFLDSMESLNNSLAVGLSYDAYLSAVNHVRSTYAPIEADRLPLLCLTRVAGAAERALNLYIDAANAWGDCLATASCDSESIEPRLQRRWAAASDGISEAQENLQNLL